MTPRNAYSAYNNSRVLTASPAELTLMLYDGAIKFCNIAAAAIDAHDIEKAHNNIRKTQRIVEEFRATLNFKYPVAQDFENVYVLIDEYLHEANMKKDPEMLQEALKHLRTMRDTWKEVMNANKAQNSAL